MVLLLLVNSLLFGAFIPAGNRHKRFFFKVPEEVQTSDSTVEIGELLLMINRSSSGTITVKISELSNGVTMYPYTIQSSSGLICSEVSTYCYQQYEGRPHQEIGTLWAVLPISAAALKGFRSSIFFELVLY